MFNGTIGTLEECTVYGNLKVFCQVSLLLKKSYFLCMVVLPACTSVIPHVGSAMEAIRGCHIPGYGVTDS